MFSFNGSGLKHFCKELGKLPALLRRAESQTLNDIAFQFKTEAEKSIIENLTSRRPEFVRRVFRVEKSNPGSLQAIAGTVQLDGSSFTGFIEQLGQTDRRVRAPTMRGRGGTAGNILPKQNRMMKGANFPDAREMDGNLPIAARLDILHRQGKKRFLMGGPEFPAGLYEFTGELTDRGKQKVRMVQNFKKPAQTRRFDWVTAALSKISEAWVNMTHNRNIEAALMKMKRNF